MLTENLQFFGLGQCGTRIGLEFSRLGYQVAFFNSDAVDFRGTGIEEKDMLLISTTGSGGSTAKGLEILEEHKQDFKNFLLTKMDNAKIQIFVVGLGGGTGGSSILSAIDIAKEAGHKVGLIATLPLKLKGMVEMDNAMRILKQLKEKDLNMFVLIDNEFLKNKVGWGDDWWKKINEYIVVRFISVLTLTREEKTSQTGLGSIDQAEIMRILQYGKGLTDIRDVYFNIKEVDIITEEELRHRLFEPCLVEGYNYKDTLAYLVNIDLPPIGIYTNFSSKVFDITREVCGSSISRLGMFVDPLLNNAIRITLVNAGLKLPKKVLRSRINNLKRDSIRHTVKRNKADSLDFSEIKDINIDEDFNV
ncbi:MAG TPA: hypothetical protein P5136_00545 [Methanofastidiosum sp.]|nr:hypothetical protein [Methanofastidiosum sp.]